MIRATCRTSFSASDQVFVSHTLTRLSALFSFHGEATSRSTIRQFYARGSHNRSADKPWVPREKGPVDRHLMGRLRREKQRNPALNSRNLFVSSVDISGKTFYIHRAFELLNDSREE